LEPVFGLYHGLNCLINWPFSLRTSRVRCPQICFGILYVFILYTCYSQTDYGTDTICRLTYLLTPWSRVLLEKLTGSAASQEIPRTHKCPPPIPILSQLRLVPTTTSHFLKIHLNIILPSASGSPQWSLFLRFRHQNPVHPFPLPHTRHMPCSSHSSQFYHPHNVR